MDPMRSSRTSCWSPPGGVLCALAPAVLATLAACALALPFTPAEVAAQTILPPSGQDVLGLYAPDPTDPDAPFTPERVRVVGGPGLYDVWIFLTTISLPTVAGFEFSLAFVDGEGEPAADVQIIDAALPTGGTNEVDWPDFVITLDGVLGGIPPYNVWLVQLTCLVNTDQPRYARLRPIPSGPTIPDALGYWDDLEPPRWQQMYPIAPDPRGDVDYARPIFAFNDEGFVTASGVTWSAVKQLFR
jgi:hypothetical protein